MRHQREISILPINKVNLVTGKNSILENVNDCWAPGNDTVAEIWQLEENKFRVIFTSGTSPIGKLDKVQSFQHDQRLSHLFTAKMVAWSLLKDMAPLAKVYGKSLPGYVYK